MTMILLEEATGLAINPADISTMRINHSGSRPVLEIGMRAGPLVCVEHRPLDRDGANIYKLHKQLLEVA